MSFYEERWQRSGNISPLLKSKSFLEKKASQTQYRLLHWWLCSQKLSDITRTCVCLLILFSFLEIEMIRHDPASSVSPTNSQNSQVHKSTVLYSVVHCSTVLYTVVQCCTVLYSVVQCCTVLYSIVQCVTVLYSVVQCRVIHSALANIDVGFI